jgi:CelD/BcsL family acetyltransferase involved in cellulose biosynthesis
MIVVALLDWAISPSAWARLVASLGTVASFSLSPCYFNWKYTLNVSRAHSGVPRNAPRLILVALPELPEQSVDALPKEFVREWTRINAKNTRKKKRLQSKTFAHCSLLTAL